MKGQKKSIQIPTKVAHTMAFAFYGFAACTVSVAACTANVALAYASVLLAV